MSKLINITDSMRQEAKSLNNIPTGEDFNRNSDERALHRYAGHLGELAFKQFIKKTGWDYTHKGGKAEPDFILKYEDKEITVDIKTRVNKDKIHKDLIVKSDFPMEMYFLTYAHWSNDEIQAIEIAGYSMKETVQEKGEEMNIHNSENKRPKLLLEQKHLNKLNQLPHPD